MAHILFEVKEIKRQGQQGLVNSMTNFHQRRLRAKETGANYELSARKNIQVDRQPLKGKRSANSVKKL